MLVHLFSCHHRPLCSLEFVFFSTNKLTSVKKKNSQPNSIVLTTKVGRFQSLNQIRFFFCDWIKSDLRLWSMLFNAEPRNWIHCSMKMYMLCFCCDIVYICSYMKNVHAFASVVNCDLEYIFAIRVNWNCTRIETLADAWSSSSTTLSSFFVKEVQNSQLCSRTLASNLPHLLLSLDNLVLFWTKCFGISVSVYSSLYFSGGKAGRR